MTRTPSPESSVDVLPDGVSALPGGLGWLVADRAAAVRLLSDDRLGVVESGPVMATMVDRLPPELAPAVADLADFAGRIMLQATPDRHRLLRKGFAPFFTAEAVAALVPGMRADAEQVLRGFVAAGGGDFMTAVAFRYAATVAGRLLGVGAAEFLRLHKLSQRLAAVAYALRAADSVAVVREGHAALRAIRGVVADARRAAPPESVLGTWRDGGFGVLPDEDVEANVVMLVQASLETVAGMLGNAAVRILRTPGALADASARERQIDESLRSDPPLKTLERAVREPVRFAGHELRAGQIVSVRVADANRTDAVAHVAGNAVLSFGWGAYRCLGARLARYESIELFAAMARLAPDAVLTDPDPEPVRHLRFHMPRSVPVRFTPAAPSAAEVTDALVAALEEHDVDRPLTSLEREVAVVVLGELGLPEPNPAQRPTTIRRWVTWATADPG